MFEWFDEVFRYVFKRNYGIDVLFVGVKLLMVVVNDRFVFDCKNFLF